MSLTLRLISILITGSLFDEVLDVMKSVINGSETERKVQYYSGHDCSIVALQLVIGVPKAAIVGMVKPASALILEIHQDAITGQFTVQVRYQYLYVTLHTVIVRSSHYSEIVSLF